MSRFKSILLIILPILISPMQVFSMEQVSKETIQNPYHEKWQKIEEAIKQSKIEAVGMVVELFFNSSNGFA